MPYIDWKRLPKAVRTHLEDRLKDRSITEDDMIRLAHWVKTNPEVPDGDWCKDFGSFTLAGRRCDSEDISAERTAVQGRADIRAMECTARA